MDSGNDYGEFENMCSYFSADEFNSLVVSDRLYVIHQNIRSFQKNYDELSVFLNGLSVDIDIICLTETWFTELSVCNIEGYRGFHVYRHQGSGGGVSVYVRDNLNSVMIDSVSYVNECLECCCVQIKGSQAHGSAITVAAVYRPPSASVAQCLLFFFYQLKENSNTTLKLIIHNKL